MRLIFVLCFSLFLFHVPASIASAEVTVKQQAKKKSSRIKVMPRKLADKMLELSRMMENKDFEGVISEATKYLAEESESVADIDIFYLNQSMAMASTEMERYKVSREYLYKAFEASKTLNPMRSQMIISWIAKTSLLLDEPDQALHWYEIYENLHGGIKLDDVLVKAMALYNLDRWEEAKVNFFVIFMQTDPSQWRGEFYEMMLKSAIHVQDRAVLLKLAEKIQAAEAGVSIEEAITILQDVEAPLEVSFVDNMKTKKVEKKKVAAPKLEMKKGEFIPLNLIVPKYPEKAVKNKICGYVIADFTVTKKGTVKKIKIIESLPKKIFDKAAKEALEQYRYEPRVANGKKVDAKGIKTKVSFDIEGVCKG